MRNGFTLVEVLVALILFEIGMLALAGTAAVAARDLATAHRTTRARVLARNRLELLQALRCPAPGAGSAVQAGGFTESWGIEGIQTVRRITVSVEFPLSRGRAGRLTLRGASLCT